MRREDLVGQTFDRLTVVAFAGMSINHKSQWECVCQCGNKVVVLGASLKSQRTTSCGCFRKEETSRIWTKHGVGSAQKRTGAYVTWLGMRDRCNNPKNTSYAAYGDRGITVCTRWDDFELFLSDMGERPEGMEIDRMDNDGHYEPCNCRWATNEEQANNTRKNRFVTIGGQRKTISQWARIAGIAPDSFANRVDSGWPEANLLLPAAPGLDGRLRAHD